MPGAKLFLTGRNEALLAELAKELSARTFAVDLTGECCRTLSRKRGELIR